MAEPRRTSKVRDLVELSRSWDSEVILRNLEEEMRRMEEGLGHMIWDAEMRRVTQCPSPLPVTPKFESDETEDELRVSVRLPRVDEENINIRIMHDRLEVFARVDESACKPYFLGVDASGPLDQSSAKSTLKGGVLEVSVRKLRRVRVKVR